MKSRLTLLFSLFIAFSSVYATVVSVQEAEQVARNFMYERYAKFNEPRDISSIGFVRTYTRSVDGIPVFYAFDMEEGFIIISADDVYEPVIGYAYEGKFMPMEGAPQSYAGLMQNYIDQIVFLRDNKIKQPADISSRWDRLSSSSVIQLDLNRDGDNIDPLTYAMWNQDNPYNHYCPEDASGPGGHTYVGCVATAMSMIMYYWRYPEVGEGQHCYYPGNLSYGQQCANFGNTFYDWTAMNNSIDNKNPFANAELQYHAAVSVNMNFSPSGSGSYSYLVPGRLDNYFRYHNAQYLEKNDYPTTTWINMLKDEIDLGRPVYYSGYNPSSGGHAFVCDGYQGDNFHFNFGWSGSGNGFYSLSDVGGFYQGQGMVRYFYPSEAGYPYHNTGTRVITSKSGSFTDGSGPVEDYLSNNFAEWIIDPQGTGDSIIDITVTFPQFNTETGDVVRIYDGENSDAPLIGEFSGTDIPEAVTSTGNILCITFTTDGSGTAPGWYAEFTTTSPQWCSGMTEFTEPTGTFDDGSGPEYYYQNTATCMWNIAPDYAGKITLYFNYFETEEGMDRVKIFDGTNQIAEFSGTDIPESVEATSGSMFVTFTTNQFNNMLGWEAYYEVDNVGIEEPEAVSQLNIYPNPADDQLTITFERESTGSYSLEIFSLTGQKVYEESSSSFTGSYSNTISVKEMNSGLYLMKVTTEEGISVKKVMVE